MRTPITISWFLAECDPGGAQAVAAIPTPALAAHSNLLAYAPPHMLVYAAAPNLSGTIKETIAMADRQSAENAVFSKWWGSGASSGLKMLLAKIQTISASLGDEIAYGMCFKSTKLQSSGVPMFLAEVQQGKRAALESILAGLGGTKSPFHYHLTDALLAISDSEASLQWLVDNLGQGANTPFVEAIAAHYKQGSSLLFGVDLETIISRSTATADAKVQAQAAGAQQIKHFFIQQRNYQGSQENEATFTFKGPRT